MASADFSVRLGRAALIAGAAFVSAAPSTYYFARVAMPSRERAAWGAPIEDLLRADLISMALMVVIAALVGSLVSERYGLGGVLRARSGGPALGRVFVLVFGLGVFAGMGSYLIFGRRLAEAAPSTYPTQVVWALALVAKGAVFDEVVARYGMMTIAAGVTRRPMHANLLQAVFFTAVGVKSMKFFGLDARLEPFVFAGLAVSFLFHLLSGRLYERYGLLAAMAFHFGLEIDRLFHALMES